jgi:DNA-binding beta-propeller fold protein YncE
MRRVRSSVLQSVVRLFGVRGREVAGAPAAAPSFRGTGASSFGVSRVGRVALVVVALAAVLLVPAAASGAPKGTIAVFGEADPDDPSVPPVSAPAGVAVHQGSGDVYVVDANNDRVQQFDQDGVFIRAWGTPGSAEGEFSFVGQYAGIAVAPDGSVYVADAGNNRIQKFEADGTFVSTWGWDVLPDSDPADPLDDPEIGFEVCTSGCQAGTADPSDGAMSNPIGVAVNPTDGTVVVADQYNNRVQRFDADGNYQDQFDTNSPQSIAVDSAGGVYTVESFGATIEKFAADGTPQGTFYQGANTFFALTVDPATDHVFATEYHYNEQAPGGDGFDASHVVELDTAGAVVYQHRFREDITDASGNTNSFGTTDTFGVAVNSTSGRIYVSQTYEDRIFILDDPVQTATMEPTTDIASRSATLNGTVNPGGDLPVGYHFEVSADEGATWTKVPETDVDVGAGMSDIAVSQDATGLSPNVAYRVRLVVANEFGSTVVSDEATFTTDAEPPDVETLPATQIRSTSAVVAGEVNSNTLETTYHFEYGTTTAFGTPVPMPGASAGDGADPVIVIDEITGLQPDTLYHYRIVASNAAGTTPGEDRTFTTRPAATDPDRRGYELVSPADKPGGVGAGPWYGGPAAVAAVGVGAYDGERFAVGGVLGSIVTEGPVGYGSDYSFAERTPGGWINKPGLNRRAHGSQLLTVPELQESTTDLSLMAFASNGHLLRLFPEMETWEEAVSADVLLVRDWTSDWELFGPTDFSQVRSGDNGSSTGKAAKAFAEDGSAIVASSRSLRGLAGPGDPTNFGDRLDHPSNGASSVYLDEITRPFSGSFPGDDGVRQLVDVCTGAGAERTVLPSGPCPAPLPGRDERLISSPGGAGLLVAGFSASQRPSPRVISADGSRVFFMSPDPMLSGSAGASQLYVRQRNSDGSVVTRWISKPEAGAPGGQPEAAYFESASRDGDKVLFRTTTALTADDPNTGTSSDVYMYDLPSGDDPAGGQLTRITAGPDGDSDCNSPENAREHGAVRFASDDVSKVYFVCAGPLIGAIDSAGGSITSPGGSPTSGDGSNLYLYDASRPAAQRWRFIARLPRGGGPMQNCATIATASETPLTATAAGLAVGVSDKGNCVSGSGDGSLVTFFTDGRLTADDPDAATGDIYGYDAARDALVRVTAPQGGAGGTYDCTPGGTDTTQCFGDGGISQGTERILKRLGVATRPDGTRVAFFESRSRLVPEDTDDAYDVYQWREGELSLISTGQSDTDGAFYVGNDRSGLNVYIATRDQLSWQDHDAVLDVYSARVGGGIPQSAPPVVCSVLANECQGPAIGVPISTNAESGRPGGDGDASPGARKTLRVGKLSRKARRRAARTGTLAVAVRISEAGRVRAVAKSRIGRRTRRVASKSVQVRKAGRARIKLRLNRAARQRLSRGKALRLSIKVTSSDARSRSIAVRLPGGKS